LLDPVAVSQIEVLSVHTSQLSRLNIAMIAAGVSPYGTVMPGTDGTSEASFVMDV
jgi:hypothetical protein